MQTVTDGTSRLFLSLPHSTDHDKDVFFRKCVTGMYVGENVAFSHRFLLDGRQTLNPTVSRKQERDVLYPPSRHRERGGLVSCANMPPHVEVSLRKGVCVCMHQPMSV